MGEGGVAKLRCQATAGNKYKILMAKHVDTHLDLFATRM